MAIDEQVTNSLISIRGGEACPSASSAVSPEQASRPTRASPSGWRASEIRNPDGSVVFKLDGLEVPAAWSQVAVDVLAQKYFRKAGVPARLKAGAPRRACRSWLCRRVADEAALAELPEAERFGGETSAQQVFDRLAGTWTYWGWKGGYFDAEADARAFYDEMRYMLARADGGAELAAVVQHRPALGLRHRRPGAGPLLRRRGHRRGPRRRPRPTSGRSRTPASSRSIQDDLVNEGGIMDLWVREARLFKYGSGTGTNFSSPARRRRAAVGRRQVVRA